MERLGMRKHRVLHRLEMHPSRCGPPMPEAAPDPTLRICYSLSAGGPVLSHHQLTRRALVRICCPRCKVEHVPSSCQVTKLLQTMTHTT